MTFDLQVNDAAGLADLDGADAPAKAVRAAEFEKGGAEVAEEKAGGGWVGNGFGAFAEEGVTEEQDRAGGHGDFIVSRVGYS